MATTNDKHNNKYNGKDKARIEYSHKTRQDKTITKQSQDNSTQSQSQHNKTQHNTTTR
jgi:hypothetical protein